MTPPLTPVSTHPLHTHIPLDRIHRYQPPGTPLPPTPATITTPNSNRPRNIPPDPTPRTIPRPSDTTSHTHPNSSTYAALSRHHRTWHSSGGARGWDTGFAGQAGDDSDHLQTLRVSIVPRPAVPYRMQEVQRYPALVVAAPGPFWRGTDLAGTAVSGEEMGAAGQGVEGGRAVSRMSRNARSETDARLVARFGAKRTVSRTVRAATVADQTAGLSPPEGTSNQEQESESERKPRDE